MVARSQFRDNATVFCVHLALGIEFVGHQPALGIKYSDPGVVAGGFKAKNAHPVIVGGGGGPGKPGGVQKHPESIEFPPFLNRPPGREAKLN